MAEETTSGGAAKRWSAGRQRLSQSVAARLEQEIRDGQWLAGERLPTEAELCERFGVSRPLIREALGALKGRGLVRSRRGSGTYVAEAADRPLGESLEWYAVLRRDRDSLFELFDLRFLIETECVRRLARRGKGANAGLAAVAGCLREMERQVADLKRFAAADLRFHLSLVEAAGNRLFAEILSGLFAHLGVRFAEGTYTDVELARKNLADHRRIFDAVAGGDEEEAAAELRKHLADSREHFEWMLAQLEAAAGER